MRGFPPVTPGQRIGLLGGSFNPPHEAHRALSLYALKRLRLDRVWWLVTPGNPLKDPAHLAPLEARIARAQTLAHDPRIMVSGLETVTRTRYTVDTVAAIRARCPGVAFVWLMGADNLATFHRWRNWRGIAAQVPIAVIDRPGTSLAACASPAAQALQRYRRPADAAPRLASLAPPAWVFLHGLKSPLSSTALREQNSKSPIESVDRS